MQVLLGQGLERQLDAVAHANILRQSFEGQRGIAVAVAEGHQRLQNVGLAVAACAEWQTNIGTEFAFEF